MLGGGKSENAATADAIGAYADGTHHYEEDITSALVMALRKNFHGRKFAGFKWVGLLTERLSGCKRRRQNPSVKRPDCPVAPEQKSGSR